MSNASSIGLCAVALSKSHKNTHYYYQYFLYPVYIQLPSFPNTTKQLQYHLDPNTHTTSAEKYIYFSNLIYLIILINILLIMATNLFPFANKKVISVSLNTISVDYEEKSPSFTA